MSTDDELLDYLDRMATVLDRAIDAQADLLGVLVAGKPPSGVDLEARIALGRRRPPSRPGPTGDVEPSQEPTAAALIDRDTPTDTPADGSRWTTRRQVDGIPGKVQLRPPVSIFRYPELTRQKLRRNQVGILC
jgi:hypothetical protein